MYLEKLETQGFKSFANKNILIFPGMIDLERRGLTAVVGPNGSGKSNIADAIRWVLGEQSMKTLRGKKSEDVIFSGSEKAGKLGMAEVSLYLNNEDGQAPIDYSQIILTRRLYRDGASEYLLNNSRVRLIDVQILLAKANFGQKTYSVIGQGMVEGFLNTSLAERKEFFDEATGVKQFQIKRDEALNKLIASYENLSQVDMLLTEIEPRLKSLTRQVNKLQRRGEIETELKEIQLNYYAKLWHEINAKFNQANREFLELEKIKLDKDKKLDLLNRRLAEMEKDNEIGQAWHDWQKELASQQGEKDRLTKQIAKIEAELEIRLEASGQFDLSWLSGKKSELRRELEKTGTETETLETQIAELKKKCTANEDEGQTIREELGALNAKISAASARTDNGDAKKIAGHLGALLAKLETAEAEHDLEKIKILIGGIIADLKKIMALPSADEDREKMEKARTRIIELTDAKEELAMALNEKLLKISGLNERRKLLGEKRVSLETELKDIEGKLKKHEDKFDAAGAGREKAELGRTLLAVEENIRAAKEKIADFSKTIEAKRSALFDLQRSAQNLQNEINQLSGQLNDLKIAAARHETKLEDLETEIRQELENLKEVRARAKVGEVDSEAARGKIEALKHQLEQIGGIDPEIEKEYIETKERFDFLSAQSEDLKRAIESLEKIIKELDVVIKERFDKEFKLISEKFEEYFKILFNGGNAKIIKVVSTEADEMEEKTGAPQAAAGAPEEKRAEPNANLKRIKYLQRYNATGLAGVEIQATPPGKKIKFVSMLSGGERALTAIALICAIISANPSPFVVLDEVDAALDEANSERLAKILDDLSHKTQFIVITHNRAAMRRANILYGVTMQDDGISKLLSVKLDEAKVGK